MSCFHIIKNFETLLGAKFHRFSSVLYVLLLYTNKQIFWHISMHVFIEEFSFYLFFFRLGWVCRGGEGGIVLL